MLQGDMLEVKNSSDSDGVGGGNGSEEKFERLAFVLDDAVDEDEQRVETGGVVQAVQERGEGPDC
jgi:hypothetical protein